MSSKAMQDHKIFTYHSLTVILLMFNVLFLKGIKSEVYTVGGDEQWNTEANFDSWTKKYNFSVGDVLVFKYNKEQHSVYEVTETTYRSCDASTGVIEQYDSGNDQITLTKAKKYSFICNVAGHCLGGMRFSIDVSNKNSTSASTSPPVEPNNACVSYAFKRWRIGICIATTCAILLFNF